MLLLQHCDAGIVLGVSRTGSPPLAAASPAFFAARAVDCLAEHNPRAVACRACFKMPHRTCALGGMV